MSIKLPSQALWLWLDLLVPTVAFASLLIFDVEALGFLAIGWTGYLVLHLVREKSQRPVVAFWLALTVYNLSAWIAVTQFNERFPPFPSESIIARGTVMSLEVIVLAYIALRLILLTVPFGSWWRGMMTEVGALAKRMSNGKLIVACLLLLTVAAIDWYQLLSLGVSSVLGGYRREYATNLLSASNHDVWVIAIGATLALSLHAIANGLRSRQAYLVYAVLAVYWLPSILAGSRQLLVAVGVSIATVAIASNILTRNSARFVKVLAGGALMMLFLLPFLETGQLSQATIEFVYPQYMLFTAMADNLPLHMSYLGDSAFMLPSQLRPTHIQVIGDQFKALNITNVGVGDSPVGEAYIDSPRYVVPIAVTSTLVVLLIVVLLSKLHPAFLVVGVGQLIVWGRSDFWVVIFYIVYGGLLLWFFMPPRRVRRSTATCLPP
jgi:hypothetical protein